MMVFSLVGEEDMTDTNVAIDPDSPAPKTQFRTVRWRIIPGTFLAIMACLGSVGVLLQLAIVVYYNMKYGWIPVDPDNPTRSQLAVTPVHVLQWQFACWGFISAGVASYAWFYGRWRVAWIGTLLFFLLMLISKSLDSV